MNTNPKVSIVIPVYNGERYITKAIESAMAQTYRNIEIVIVNDGSKDSSYEKIRPYLNLPNVKYIEQANKGVAAARNTGIKNSTGEFITFLDQDDLWLPDKLEVQVYFMAENSDIGLCQVGRGLIDKDGNPREFWWNPMPEEAVGRCFKKLFMENRVYILAVMVRRKCLEEVGYFDEQLGYTDDWELWMRVSRKFNLGYIDQQLCLYRIHDTNTMKNEVGMELAKIKAINIILEKFPEVYGELGKGEVKGRLYDLHYGLSAIYRRHGLYINGSRHLLKAIGLKPSHFFLNMIPPSQRKAVDWYVHKYFKGRSISE